MGCKSHMSRVKVTYKLVTKLTLNASFRESKRGYTTLHQMLRVYTPDNSDPAARAF